jgi:mortality factor 4-like protein 1
MWDVEDGDEENGPHYMVHYQGWKKTWDEWVTEERMLKDTAENRRKAEDMKRAEAGGKRRVKKDDAEEKPKKAKKEPPAAVEKAEVFARRSDVKIAIPDTLKLQLVDDWENITQHQKVYLKIIFWQICRINWSSSSKQG